MKRGKMGDSSTEIVVPRANEYNFGFTFNDIDFSDRILRLVIIPDSENIDSDKKLRGLKYHERFSSIEGDCSKDSESYDGVKVVTLHITSAILAEKSPFFYKLFKNGMQESQQKNDVSLRIYGSEEATLMDLLNFMYGNTLNATSATDLVDLLIAADKFEVNCCMSYCVEMLLELPASLEYALLYLELPSSVLVSAIVQPLIDEAKKYVVAHFKDFTKFKEEAMDLPLSTVEVVLGSEGLQVGSEDDIFDFILEWARAHYPELEERREILAKCLIHFICFPNMSSSMLKKVLVCPDFDHEQISKHVVDALFSKVELICGQHVHPSKDLVTTNQKFSGRVYKPRCFVYFDLKKEECADLFPAKHVNSSEFCLGGKRFFLAAKVREQEERHFGLFLYKVKGSEPCTLDYEFAALKKSSKEFKIVKTGKNLTFGDNGWGWGSPNLLKISWTDFMSDDCDYFVDGVLRLRAEIALINISQP